MTTTKRVLHTFCLLPEEGIVPIEESAVFASETSAPLCVPPVLPRVRVGLITLLSLVGVAVDTPLDVPIGMLAPSASLGSGDVVGIPVASSLPRFRSEDSYNPSRGRTLL